MEFSLKKIIDQNNTVISRMVFCFAGILSLFVPFHHFVGFNSFWPDATEMENVEIYSTGRVLASIETQPIIQNEPDLADLANRIIQTWSPIFMFIFLNLVIFLYFMYRVRLKFTSFRYFM